MKRTIITATLILIIAAALGLTLFTRAKKANAEVTAGNQAFSAQQYETALQHYTKAQSQAPDRPEPLYNAANVFYQQQTLDQAQQALEQALAQPGEAADETDQADEKTRSPIAASIHYNLGNVAYQAQQFDAAIGQYEAALRLEPSDQSAKYNLELALQQKQQQDQQDQQNQQDKQDKQDKQDQQNQQGQQDQQDQQNQQGQQDQQNQQGQQGQQDQQDQQGQAAGAGQPGQQQQDGQPNGLVPGTLPPGMTPQQALQLLAAIAGNSQTLLQQLQSLYYYPPVSLPGKDW